MTALRIDRDAAERLQMVSRAIRLERSASDLRIRAGQLMREALELRLQAGRTP